MVSNSRSTRAAYDEENFAHSTVTVCGKTFVADKSGALFWPDEDLLIVADLHLEKGSSFAKRGSLLPPYDTRSTLGRLYKVTERFDPATIVALGDSLHEASAADRMGREELDLIHELQENRSWYWVTGNHDPEIPEFLGGQVVDDLTVGGLSLRHEPFEGPVTHEIAGHLHPAAKIAMRGHSMRRPCFVSNGRRLVVPAFGAYTGGLNVMDDAFAPLFGGQGVYIWMLGHEGIYPVAARQLKED